MKKLAIFLLILTVIIGILGFYYYQRNIYSKDVLKLEILGPSETEALQEVKYVVKYKNNGDVRLDEPELIFEYPEYALPSEGNSRRIIKKAEELGGAIYPGEERTFVFAARLLGHEGETKEAKAILTYQPKNLKARYTSQTSFTTVINRVALGFNFDLSSRMQPEKEFKFNLNYFSSIAYPLTGLRLIVDYPVGFEFISSNPKSLEKNEWEIGALNETEGGRIEINGKLSGQIGEEKVFRARLGVWQNGEFILLKETTKGISLVRPALYITQHINNNPKFVAQPGDLLHYEIFFKNIGDDFLNELFLLVTLDGAAFDFNTLQAPDGDFTPGQNSIMWDWHKIKDLQLLPPQKEGKVEFWIKLKDEWEIKDASGKNPEIKTTVYLNQIKEEFVNQIKSKLIVYQKGYFNDEVFGNSGPIPPVVGQATTYTIIWQIVNYYNDIKNAKVSAVLPANVNIVGGKFFPPEQMDKFTFDWQSREIIWQIGNLGSGAGVTTPAPYIAFQVVLLPDPTQRGRPAELIGPAKITGEDQWTGAILESTAASLNTLLPDDSSIGEAGGLVR
ncbi:MAG: hypothetical protein ACPLW9_02060 [Minisyncoccales bacterium]